MTFLTPKNWITFLAQKIGMTFFLQILMLHMSIFNVSQPAFNNAHFV